MQYQADFPRMRSALEEIRNAFPIESGIPSQVLELFNILAQLDFDNVAAWSEKLGKRHLDLLCDHYHEAPTSRVILVLVLILWHKQDGRIKQVTEHWIHRIPLQAERHYLADQWLQMQSSLTNLPKWFKAYLERGAAQEPVAYLTEALSQNMLTAKELERDFPEVSPLFRALTDSLFANANELCHSISASRAHAAAMRYLQQGQDSLLLAYLTHYPHERWVPELMNCLRTQKGPPDPEANAFWQQLERPRLWGIRGFMFQEQMKTENYPSDKIAFWRDWLHKTQAWYFKPNHVRILAKPLLIEDDPNETRIAMVQSPHHWLAKVPQDYSWEAALSKVLQEYLSWDNQF